MKIKTKKLPIKFFALRKIVGKYLGKSYMKLGLLVILFIAGLGAGLVYRQLNNPAVPKEYKYPKLVIRTDLNNVAANRIANFINYSLKENFRPLELTLQLVKKGSNGSGDEHVGVWGAGGKIIQLLYVAEVNTSRPTYLRIWYLPEGNNIDQSKAQIILSDIFSNSAISETGNMECKSSKDEKDRPTTVCSAIANSTVLDKQGVLVRAPMSLPNGQDVTLASFCQFPKESIQWSIATYCF